MLPANVPAGMIRFVCFSPTWTEAGNDVDERRTDRRMGNLTSQKILVVDDSPTELRLAVSGLKSKGYLVVTAIDGEEVLSKAVAEQPDLIVLDVVLPKKNGFQVCRQLKTSPKTQPIKIILLSSKCQETDRFWGLRQGADMYMTKPFEDEELAANIEVLLR